MKNYPVSGTKPIHKDRWFAIVHDEKRSFVANTIADIATVFPDYELIKSLGCGAVINLPVVLRGQLAATINLLDAERAYTPERVTLYFTESALRLSTTRTDGQLDAVRLDVRSRVAMMRAGGFAATPGASCRYCAFRAMCPDRV